MILENVEKSLNNRQMLQTNPAIRKSKLEMPRKVSEPYAITIGD